MISPESDPPLLGGGRRVKARADAFWVKPPIRRSPKLLLPCWKLPELNGAPLSETWTVLMFATFSQTAKASWIARCQFPAPNRALSVETRLLGVPPRLVPSGSMLQVI